MQPGTVYAIMGYTIMASVIAILLFPASLLAIDVTVVQEDKRSQIRWENALHQKPEWYAGFECAGKRYGHIIDPRTGWPASGVAGVTVVTASAAVADAPASAIRH